MGGREDPDVPVDVALVLPVRPADEQRVSVDEGVIGDVWVRRGPKFAHELRRRLGTRDAGSPEDRAVCTGEVGGVADRTTDPGGAVEGGTGQVGTGAGAGHGLGEVAAVHVEAPGHLEVSHGSITEPGGGAARPL